MVEQRNVALCVILTIVTCGIYGIYWLICLVNDLNYATGMCSRRPAAWCFCWILSPVAFTACTGAIRRVISWTV